MNSSTSNSKTRSKTRQSVWIGLTLLLLFGVAEVGARKYARRRENDLSDHRDFSSLNARAADLMQKPGRKIVFVGNSATQEGVDLPLFERAMRQNGAPVQTTMCTAVDSGVKDWHWMLDKSYFAPGRRPDLLVVTFFSANLDDIPVIERGRMAQFFTAPRDWPEVFATDVTTVGERADFVGSYASILYAMRDTTQEKLLRLAAPGYEKWALQLNDATRRQDEERKKEASKTPDSNRPMTHRALQRLLAKAQRNGAELCFIAYPRRDANYAYEISPEVVDSIRQAGMIFLDLRQTPGLSPDKYRDSVHVNAQGREIWTRIIAEKLAPLIGDSKAVSR